MNGLDVHASCSLDMHHQLFSLKNPNFHNPEIVIIQCKISQLQQIGDSMLEEKKSATVAATGNEIKVKYIRPAALFLNSRRADHLDLGPAQDLLRACTLPY